MSEPVIASHACDWPGCEGQCHTGSTCPCHRPCGEDWFCGSCDDCLTNPDPENQPRASRKEPSRG